MGADNDLLRRTKAILATPEGNRESMIRALEFQKEGRTKGASAALKWLQANQKCAKCDEIKPSEGFNSEHARAHCSDCRVESKQSFFFALPAPQAAVLVSTAESLKVSPRDLVIQWVVERLEGRVTTIEE